HPAENIRYTITAEGPGGSATASATLNVVADNAEVDLEPTSIDLSEVEIDPGSLILSGPITVEVVNNGSDPPGKAWEITLFEDLNADEALDETVDNILSRATVNEKPPQGETVVVAVETLANVLFRGNRIMAMADSARAISEMDESNNVIHHRKDCRVSPQVGSFDPVVEYHWEESDVNPNSNQVVHTPVVGNLSDDNLDGFIDDKDIPDILFSTHVDRYCKINGTLRAISGDGAGELFSITEYKTLPVCSPALGDIDNDGLVEILVLEEYNDSMNQWACVLAFENNGDLKWRSPSLHIWGGLGHAISIADLHNDGSPEIIIGRHVLNHDGSILWKGEGASGRNHTFAADVTLDGFPEIIAGNTLYDRNGSILWRNTSITGDGFTAIGNFDPDPYPEIVVVAAGYVYLLEHTGEIIWGPIDIPKPGISKDQGGPPTIADFDGDGRPEIGVAAGYRYVVFETDGSVKWEQIIDDKSSNATGSSVFDLESDGSSEVIYADENHLRIFRGEDGENLYEILVGSRTRTEYPLIVDVDNDNNAEIVVVANNIYGGAKNGVIILGDAGDSWVNTRKIWNQHAYSITNVEDDGSIPRI
ncbi:MAG: hypothetical protein GY859_43385, partial [Desulfobacterales bacterium]|nr:hypothetical protein [Desulfobacterales bacterium]